jgi:hypothetical protein
MVFIYTMKSSDERPHPYVTPVNTRGRVKVKLFLCLTKHHTMKTYWESEGTVPHILNLSSRWR